MILIQNIKKSRWAVLSVICLLVLFSACNRTETERSTSLSREPSLTLEQTELKSEAKPEPELEADSDSIQVLMKNMTLDKKVGQLFFVRCPETNAVEDIIAYHLGGYVLFSRDFQDTNKTWLTKEQFVKKIQDYQAAAAEIPLLIGVDEEGGTVIRASRNPNLFPDGKCLSPQWIAQHGGDFVGDAKKKNSVLLSLGINTNLAPVCDVSIQSDSFIYKRTLGQDAVSTAGYIEQVVTAMKDQNIGSVLKHFPGYGNNADTHTGIAIDTRPLESFWKSDFLPFQAGLKAGGTKTAVLMSHNIINCVDAKLPASLSPTVHEILRKELKFDGVIMTDDLAMDAVAAYAQGGAVAVMALQAGNDLILTTDYRTQIPKVLKAVESGQISEQVINTACRRVLVWKQALGLLE